MSMLVGGLTPRVVATYNRLGDPANETYTVGDIIANSKAAGDVVPILFPNTVLDAGGSGRIIGAKALLSVASGNVAVPAFDLLLFRPDAGVPFAAGAYPADNAALTISPDAYRSLIGVLSFSASAWRNAAGGATGAGLVAWQAASFAAGASGLPYAPFNFGGANGAAAIGVMQAQSATALGTQAYRFDFELLEDLD